MFKKKKQQQKVPQKQKVKFIYFKDKRQTRGESKIWLDIKEKVTF